MQLRQHFLDLFGYGQTEMGGVFDERNALVGEIKEDHRRAENRTRPDDLGVLGTADEVDSVRVRLSLLTRTNRRQSLSSAVPLNVSDTHQRKDQHLAADALEADLRGQLLVGDGAHHAGDVVHRDKGDQRVKQPVAFSEKPAQPAADSRDNDLNDVPEFLHFSIPRFK